MKRSLSALTLAMIAMGIAPEELCRKPRVDELDMWLRLNKHTLAEEVELLSKRKAIFRLGCEG